MAQRGGRSELANAFPFRGRYACAPFPDSLSAQKAWLGSEMSGLMRNADRNPTASGMVAIGHYLGKCMANANAATVKAGRESSSLAGDGDVAFL